MYYIYAHIVPNGKMYVGMTKNTKKRWGAQKYKGCSKFYKAILEYGWKNIEHVILETTNDIIEARGLEKEYILKYNTINRLKSCSTLILYMMLLMKLYMMKI